MRKGDVLGRARDLYTRSVRLPWLEPRNSQAAATDACVKILGDSVGQQIELSFGIGL